MGPVHLPNRHLLLRGRHAAHVEGLWAGGARAHDGRKRHGAMLRLSGAVELLLQNRRPAEGRAEPGWEGSFLWAAIGPRTSSRTGNRAVRQLQFHKKPLFHPSPRCLMSGSGPPKSLHPLRDFISDTPPYGGPYFRDANCKKEGRSRRWEGEPAFMKRRRGRNKGA